MNADQVGFLLAVATVCAALKVKGHTAEADRYKFRLTQGLRAAGLDPDEVYDSMVKYMESEAI